MPTVKENKKYWDGDYSWKSGGNEWSADWGAVSMQWYGTILPRIHSFLPANAILEIGCGYGRWTGFLKDTCDHLIAVDLSEECIRACQQRFRTCSHVSFHCNDGTSLDFLDDRSIDFVFSFDALPLVDPPTIEAYIAQLLRILKDDGCAFLHHSNLGAYDHLYKKVRKLPYMENLLTAIGVLDRNLYWRESGVSADLIQQLASKYGLMCVSQELIRWGTKYLLIDAFSVITREPFGGTRTCKRLKNRFFDSEAANLRQLASLYTREKEAIQSEQTPIE
jgi:SAM-dependent methyltransferase